MGHETQNTGATSSARLTSIDAARGLVMVIMALDHVRDLLHHDAMLAQPTDLRSTTILLFFTRWVTHLCAPMFMLTSGLGAYLWWRRGHTRGELSRFLATRGLWLMVLELTVMRVAYNFSLSTEYPLMLIVLWVLGLCMVCLAALVWLPLPAVALLSLATIALHNLLDPIRASQLGSFSWLWFLLHQVGAFPLFGTVAIVGYPLIPWVAVTALGFAIGPWFAPLRQVPAKAGTHERLMLAGLAATALFIALRAVNGYGDPSHWADNAKPFFTLLSFLNTTKYPPSLLYLLMTLGPGLLLLAWFQRHPPSARNPLVIFGRVPLFYFVGHFFLVHAATALLALARYGDPAWAFVFTPVPTMGGPAALYPADFGVSLGATYLVWVGVVLLMYPACRWFAALKTRRRDWWLSYL